MLRQPVAQRHFIQFGSTLRFPGRAGRDTAGQLIKLGGNLHVGTESAAQIDGCLSVTGHESGFALVIRWESADAQFPCQIGDSGLAGPDPLATGFRELIIAQVVIQGATTDAIHCLQHHEGFAASALQITRCRQASQSTTQDGDIDHMIACACRLFICGKGSCCWQGGKGSCTGRHL